MPRGVEGNAEKGAKKKGALHGSMRQRERCMAGKPVVIRPGSYHKATEQLVRGGRWLELVT